MTAPSPSSRVVTTLIIPGMRAVHAVRAVYTGLAGVEGIVTADVTLGRAVIEHDGRATGERLAAAVALAGYEVEQCTEERGRLPTL